MKFYELPEAVSKAIRNPKIRPYVRVSFEKADDDVFISDSDIISCVVTSYKSAEGGIVNFGELVLDNSKGKYSAEEDSEYTSGLGVQIWYCFGNAETSFLRFHLFTDGKGFQNEATGSNERTTTIRLVDLSARLDNEKLQKDWSGKQVVVNGVVCDKENPEKSLVHILAKRGGFEAEQVNSGKIALSVPYVMIESTVWKELCALARAYNAVLECGRDLSLSFDESPFDSENEYSDEAEETLDESEITRYRAFNDYENYANCVRVKYTRYVEAERQELWNFSDSHAWYDDEMKTYYPFTDDTRDIVAESYYEAVYTAKNSEGKTRSVVYAEDIDDAETFLENMVTAGGKKFEILKYNTSSYKDRAIVQLGRGGQNIALYKAAISGKPIIAETNSSVYLRNEAEIEKHGQIVKNVTSKYLSTDEIDGKAYCEVWAEKMLEECVKSKRGYYITTYIALIGARVGARMKIRLCENGCFKEVSIDELTFRYKKDAAFSTEIWVKSV